MTRLEIQQRFRDENPEITVNVVSVTTLNSWCLQGDKEICAKARLIVDTGSIVAIEDQKNYDLSALLNKFYDIDEIPGGGLSTVSTSGIERRVVKSSKSELDANRPSWRTGNSGTPKNYFRRGKYAYVVPAPDSSIASMNVDFVAISDDFNNDNITPYNQLTYLEPFHPAMVFYLTWRAKAKIGKPEEAASTKLAYDNYVLWMKREIGGGKYGAIQLKPEGLPSIGSQRI